MSSSIDDTYRCIVPLATFLLRRKYKIQRNHVFDSMLQMTNIQDDVYKTLSALQFKVNYATHDFRALIARGQVCPDVADAATVELDATVWITEKLAPIQQMFALYDIAGAVEAIASYDAQRDAVLFVLRPIINDYIDDSKRFVPINIVITVQWLFVMTILIAWLFQLFS